MGGVPAHPIRHAKFGSVEISDFSPLTDLLAKVRSASCSKFHTRGREPALETFLKGGGPMDLSNRGREARRTPPPDGLGTALWLAGRGLWPVPITPHDDEFSPNPGKAPIGSRWGVERLTTRAL